MNDLHEKLAEYTHDAWSGWMRYLFRNWNDIHIKNWKRQMSTPYKELSEKEKDSDRKEADKILNIIKKKSPMKKPKKFGTNKLEKF